MAYNLGFFLFGFIVCLHQTLAQVVLPDCPPNWTRFTKSCYKLYKEPKSWHDAGMSCSTEERYGHLVSFSSREENDFVTYVVLQGIPTRAWIGLNDQKEEGSHVWYTHHPEPFVYQNWKPNEPSDDSHSENCVAMVHAGPGKWNDFTCRRRLSYVCELDLEIMAKGAKSYGDGLKGVYHLPPVGN